MTMVHVQLRPTEFGTCGPQKSRMAVFRINVTLLQGFAFSLGNIADCKEVQSVQNFGELQVAKAYCNASNLLVVLGTF